MYVRENVYMYYLKLRQRSIADADSTSSVTSSDVVSEERGREREEEE
jgi:hypothetical protein